MSKIVDALRKLQDERSENGFESPRKHRKIARIEQDHTNATDHEDNTVVDPTASRSSSRIVNIDVGAMREAGLIAPDEAIWQLLEDIDFPCFWIDAWLPPPPGAVILEEVASPALPKGRIPRPRP